MFCTGVFIRSGEPTLAVGGGLSIFKVHRALGGGLGVLSSFKSSKPDGRFIGVVLFVFVDIPLLLSEGEFESQLAQVDVFGSCRLSAVDLLEGGIVLFFMKCAMLLVTLFVGSNSTETHMARMWCGAYSSS